MKMLIFSLKWLTCLYLIFLFEGCIKEPKPPAPGTEKWLLSKMIFGSSYQEYKYNARNKPVSRFYYSQGKQIQRDTFIYNASNQLIELRMFSSPGANHLIYSYKYDLQGRLTEELRTTFIPSDSLRTYFIYRGNTVVDSACETDEFGIVNCAYRGNESIYDNAGNLIKRLIYEAPENPDHCCDDTIHVTDTIEYAQYDNHRNPKHFINLKMFAGYLLEPRISENNPGWRRRVDLGYYSSYVTTDDITYIYNNENLVQASIGELYDTIKYEYIRRR